MRKILLFTLCLFTSLNIFAQDPRQFEDPYHLKETGKLFEVKIFPGPKETKIFIAGKKTAQINFKKLRVEAILNLGDQEKRLVLQRKDDHFITSDLTDGSQLRLKVESNNPKTSEELRIKLRPVH